jgi:hypothetical protein
MNHQTSKVLVEALNPSQHPGNAATVISVKSVYSGGKQLL